MIRATVSVSSQAGARLRLFAAQLKNPVAMYKDAGRRITNDLRKHFVGLDDSQPNRLGGKRTHFWLDVRDATQNPEIDPQGATVTIAHLAFAQKLYGGTIRAKAAKALTIPLIPEAHGRFASTFEEEMGVKLFRPKGTRILAMSKDGDMIPVYALAKAASIKAEPKALPPAAAISAAVLDTASKHVARILARGG